MANGVEMTGVFATDAEMSKLRALAAQGWRDGDRIMTHSLGEGLRRDEATQDAMKRCHALALEHGLPEIKGYYGLTEKGEFVTSP